MSLKLGKILITGGAGFIGSHLAQELIKNNNDVIVLDNLSSGFESNLKICKNGKNFKLIIEDISNIERNSSILKDVKTVFHIAAYPEVRTGYECGIMIENYSDIKVNDIIETFEIIETIRKL